MAMAKKKLNVEEIIELLKASYDGMPNFTPILNKGTIDTLYEINEKTVHSPEISTGYYGFCKKSEIVSELNRLFCELLLDIRANGDLHQQRRTEITRENGIERTRSYYNDVVKAWLYQFSRTNRPVEYKDKIIEVNLQPETSAYTPEITQTVEQPSHFFPADVNPSKPKNAHEVVMLMESYGTILAPETEQQEQAQPEASAQETTPATTEQQEPTTRDMLSKMTVKEIQAIARLVGVKNIFKWSKSSLISRTSCMIHCAFDDIKATALKMTRENFMKIINITDTEYLSLVFEELGYRSDLSREDCIKTFEEIFDDTNREAGRYNTLPHVEQEISEQEKERRQYEEFMQLDAKVKAAGTSSVLSTMEHFVYVSLLRQGFRQKHINDNEPTTLTSASTPAPVKINPEVKPNYDAAFDESAYTPDYQPNRAVLDDEPQPHRLIIKRRTAPAGRKLPTPKSRRQVYDFSKCADADTLRKALNAGSIDVVKAIAESYREFQPRTNGKNHDKERLCDCNRQAIFPRLSS